MTSLPSSGASRDDERAAADVTPERAAEDQLRETTAFLDSIVENIPHMIFVKEAGDLRFKRFNRAGEVLLGVAREDLLGKSDLDLFPKEQAEFFQRKDREVLEGRIVVEIGEEPIDTPHGKRWLRTKKIPILDAAGVPRYLLGISEDITDRKEMEDSIRIAHDELELRVIERTEALTRAHEQLRQAQKMEAIGRLAGGVAHDFNNLLSVILSYSEMLLANLSVGDPMHEELLDIQSAGARASELTKQLLTFGRQQVLSPRVIDLNETISEMSRLLERIIGEDIELQTLPAADLGKAKIDPSQLEQILMNLVVNARDAMPTGGKLTIETRNIELSADYAREHLGVIAGSHVMLAVSDTGMGMDKATQARVFEPFFTTKPKGKGTGLGLATVFGIVQQSGGSIWLYSEPGKGSVFKIYFPRTDEVDQALMPTQAGVTVSAPSGMETVLLVEDERQVRALVRTLLKRQGYRVLEAESASDALLVCERFPERIDLLVTDVVMPQMSGRQLADHVAALRPEARVLYMSGYTDHSVVHHGTLEAGVTFLQKPITPESLARKVREALGRE